jgi:hypothetical protein
VLLYACQGSEVTVETDFPGPGGKRYGLLTYTLNRILRGATAPLTYEELGQRIHQQYTALNRTFPTPILLGSDSDRVVQGDARLRRSQFTIRDDDGELRVDGGLLSGLTRGSVLAVHPPVGQAGGLRGHVRIERAEPLFSVVVPCAYEGKPEPKRSAVRTGRCEPAYLDMGDLQMSIYFDRAGSKAAAGELGAWQRALQELTKSKTAPLRLVRDAAEAEWLIRIEKGKAALIRSADARQKDAQLIWLPPLGKAADLKEFLIHVARSHNLLKIAAAEMEQDDQTPKLRVELWRLDPHTEKPLEKITAATPRLYQGDLVRYRITNVGRTSIDLTILGIDTQMQLGAVFPTRKQDENSNRRGRGESVEFNVEVETKHTGRDHLVLLAARSPQEIKKVDFTPLAAKAVERSLPGPLGAVLKRAADEEGRGARGMEPAEASAYTIQVLPVQVSVERRPAKK